MALAVSYELKDIPLTPRRHTPRHSPARFNLDPPSPALYKSPAVTGQVPSIGIEIHLIPHACCIFKCILQNKEGKNPKHPHVFTFIAWAAAFS